MLTKRWSSSACRTTPRSCPTPTSSRRSAGPPTSRSSPSCGGLVLGMAMALVLNARFPGRNVLRSVVLIPWAMSPVAVGILWGWIFDGTYGTLNALLFDLRPDRQERSPGWPTARWAFNIVALVHVWNQAPLTCLLILAGLQSMPENLHRAARIDGAGPVAALLQDHAALAAADAAAGHDPDQHQLDHGLRSVLDHDQGRPGQRHHRLLLDGLRLRLPVLPLRRGCGDPSCSPSICLVLACHLPEAVLRRPAAARTGGRGRAARRRFSVRRSARAARCSRLPARAAAARTCSPARTPARSAGVGARRSPPS